MLVGGFRASDKRHTTRDTILTTCVRSLLYIRCFPFLSPSLPSCPLPTPPVFTRSAAVQSQASPTSTRRSSPPSLALSDPAFPIPPHPIRIAPRIPPPRPHMPTRNLLAPSSPSYHPPHFHPTLLKFALTLAQAMVVLHLHSGPPFYITSHSFPSGSSHLLFIAEVSLSPSILPSPLRWLPSRANMVCPQPAA